MYQVVCCKYIFSVNRNKGVKVELGIPYELWDKPSVEITNMKTQVGNYLK